MDLMNVLYAVLVLSVMGCVFGLVLAIASKVFAVEVDPRVEEIAAVLPGANCGGCGFAGCAACAKAMAEGKAPLNACAAGGAAAAEQIAKIMGAARIIAVNRSNNAQRFAIAAAFGATHLICSSQEDIVERVKEITNSEMVPVIIDAAGKNEILALALHLLNKGGEFIKIGYDNEPMDVSLDRYVNKGIRIQGHFAYDYTSWKNCLRLMELGKLDVRPIITHRLPLSAWEEGFELTEARKAVKVILIP